MAKDKLGNLLTLVEYANLQGTQKATKKTDVGGFAVLELHAVGKEDQIDEIKKNLDKCSKKVIRKIYKLVDECNFEKGTKEYKEKKKEKEEAKEEKEEAKSSEPKDDDKEEKEDKKDKEVSERKNNRKI